MLESFSLKNVGPSPAMEMKLADRLNLITGDNGLGKSFLLDVAWWILTRTWARHPAIPRPGVKSSITYQYTKRTKNSYQYTSFYDPSSGWSVKSSRPAIPGLILYAQVDGGFSVWDPTRNYWTSDAADRPNSFNFTPDEVWNGNQHCKGLLDDWALWQAGKDSSFDLLIQVLDALSPSPEEKLIPGDLRKITTKDPQRYPTLRMPYGEDVPVIYASAGMKRIISLAYLLTWAWQEHVENCNIRGESPSKDVIFLVDEIEGHLHPQWQRRIIPALLNVMDSFTEAHQSNVQLIAATHSPLVLASVESFFDPEKDRCFDLLLEDGAVQLNSEIFAPRGEVGNWLSSGPFRLGHPRSVESERAIQALNEVYDSKVQPDIETIRKIDKLLEDARVPDIDPLWVRWNFFKESNAADVTRYEIRKTVTDKPQKALYQKSKSYSAEKERATKSSQSRG